MLVRLLQNFSSVSLARDIQPPKSIPPASWVDVPGRQSVEKVWPKSNLTMFIDVSHPACGLWAESHRLFFIGWPVGQIGRSSRVYKQLVESSAEVFFTDVLEVGSIVQLLCPSVAPLLISPFRSFI